MDKNLIKVSLRIGGLYLEPSLPVVSLDEENPNLLTAATIYTIEEMVTNGLTIDQRGLRMLNHLAPEDQAEVLEAINDVFGNNLNWTPLVKNWQEPTQSDWHTNLYVQFYNYLHEQIGFDDADAVRLPCGCLIPPNTFDLPRYNGCPLCGKPFKTTEGVLHGGGTKLKVLRGMDSEQMYQYFISLLSTKTPLDATALDNLHLLLHEYQLPDGYDSMITIKEVAAEVALTMLDRGDKEVVAHLLKNPNDVLRTLWYGVTGNIRIIKPSTLIRATLINNRHICPFLDNSLKSASEMEQALKLKYPRPVCRLIADIFNNWEIDPDNACEIMHPHRGMWVRFIRALRLAEYARKPGYDKLHTIIDRFYRKDYTIWQGQVNSCMESKHYTRAVNLLKQRPGEFARQLFNVMLSSNPYTVLDEFATVSPRLPVRLLISLANSAETYLLNDSDFREIVTITGTHHMAQVNPKLRWFDRPELLTFSKSLSELLLNNLREIYARDPQPGKTIYIDPRLFSIPLPVGDRSKTIAAVMSVPQGTSFPLDSDKVRVFLHWGRDLPAAPIDLDISGVAIYPDKTEICNYTRLTVPGMQHSGDMRQIPDMVGTAEYIEVDVDTLQRDGAIYVAFTMNAYSTGAITANTMAGWMNSAHEMHVDNETGVAYDPSTVDYLIKIDDNNISKGMVFAVLDVKRKEMIWLEIPFNGQTVESLDCRSIDMMLLRLRNKLSIGKTLEIMAEAKGMVIVPKEDIKADTEVYNRQWAYDAAAVSNKLL